MGWRRWSYLLVAGLVLALAGCHAIRDETTPTEPTSPRPTLAPIAIPVILPTPKPTPTPTAPTGRCGLPASNPSNPVCTDESPQFLSEMEKAIDAVTESHPEYF